ncbi:TPM domain-containing protein [Paenibacillus zeisoli]|uniref:TPM domain-containing protein n=1 Tax=Paenibacillus zeisoli TaxID=2496267 RepID=A0A433XCQ9_9BACL|nr:TPM domain-containing protein [Paenibacillus zeisoli]
MNGRGRFRLPAALTASLLLLLLLLGGAASVSAALDIPEPIGDIYVQDFEGLLSAEQKTELTKLGRALEDATKAQVAVLTVPTLGGADIEQYGNQALRKYALGNKELNNGVLFLLSMGERQARIEVGYGLEGAIPDGKAGRILDSTAIPYLKENKPDQAIVQTYKALYNEVAAEYGVQDKLNPESVVLPESGTADGQGTGGGISIVWIIVIIGLLAVDFIFFRGAITMTLLSMMGRGGGGGWGGGGRGGGGGGGFRGGGGGSSGGGGASRRF